MGRFIRAVIGFTKAALSMPFHWNVWLVLLLVVNMIAPLLFIDTLEAKLTLAAFALGVTIQMLVFDSKGFVRLLGLGHTAWLALVPWMATRIGDAADGSTFQYWMMTLVAINGVSVLIDVVDVIRYSKGERDPTA